MKDKFIELAPAKINLFLKILSKRTDNYHNIRSGITFINLFDEITVEKSSFFKITYIGKFAPKNNFYIDVSIQVNNSDLIAFPTFVAIGCPFLKIINVGRL